MVNKLEALLEAIGHWNGAFDNPESDAYRLRNPLLIKSFALWRNSPTDDSGRRAFTSMLAGYKACLFDLIVKLSGQSRARLKPTDTLENLFRVYGISSPTEPESHNGIRQLDKRSDSAAYKKIISFFRRAIGNQEISVSTPLSFFSDALPETTVNRGS